MKRSILALALVAVTFTAQAANWVEVATSEKTGAVTYMDSETVSTSGGVGGLTQTIEDGKVIRHFASVSRRDCLASFGTMVVGAIDGNGPRGRIAFVLGSGASIGDNMADHLCARLSPTRK